jgi:hypothetical protein
LISNLTPLLEELAAAALAAAVGADSTSAIYGTTAD